MASIEDLYDEWIDAVDPFDALRAGLYPILEVYGVTHVGIKDVVRCNDGWRIHYGWSARSCEQSDDILIPYTVIRSSDPIAAAARNVEFNKNQEVEKQRQRDIRELERLQKKVYGL